MIRFFDKKDREAVISLWQEAFGDKREEITVFLDFFKDILLVFEKDGQIVSMLTLIKTSIGDDRGRYIYAVATDKRFRGMGFASRLIDFTKQFISESNEKFLVLVPQENALFDFYKKRGFFELCCAEKIEQEIKFDENIDVKAKIIDTKEYFLFREEYFAGKKYAVWDIKMLEFMKNAYRGVFYSLKKDSTICGAAFCYKFGDVLVISELLQTGNANASINALGTLVGVKKAVCLKAQEQGEKFAMIYPREFEGTYFGLAMK